MKWTWYSELWLRASRWSCPKHKVIAYVLGVALASLWLPSDSDACECGWAGPFSTVARTTDLIIRGKVLRYYGRERGVDLAMEVEVHEVLQGIERKKTIRIWGDNGMLCRPYVSTFPINTEWVFAISKAGGTKPRKYVQHEAGDYLISICGAYWLRIEGDEVVGHISSKEMADEEQRMHLDVLKERLTSTVSSGT